ncbi:MAG: DNA helicase RecQ [Sumerlaeia bacterium]
MEADAVIYPEENEQDLRLLEVLRKHWGYSGFRPLQLEAMKCVLDKRDSVVILPTGAGKSVCFQVPALLMPGLALVVSPLISLMKDQVDSLRANGIAADFFHSGMNYEDRQRVEFELREGMLKFLYVSPERLLTEQFLSLIQRQTICFVAVDEAHCVSMWGHDFRPEYRMLASLRKKLTGIAIHAFTATATELVRNDISTQLGLKKPVTLVGSFDRPNLILRAERRKKLNDQLLEVIKRHRDESGIIYCISRKDVEKLATDLTTAGFKVLPYHAGLPDADRQRNQEAFIREEVDIIVATVAFGMGIDKPNVRYVIHASMPKSLEHYQQESGRAGRDGLLAECLLLHSDKDFVTWNFLSSDLEKEPKKIFMDQINAISAYCNSSVCRRVGILRHFGQEYEKENCGRCDVCMGEVEYITDALMIGQKILSSVFRLKGEFGADYNAEILCGSRIARLIENGHDSLSTYGLLKECSKGIVREWIEQLVAQGFMVKEGEYQQISVTPSGWEVIRGNTTPRLMKPAEKPTRGKPSKTEKTDSDWVGVDRALFEQLRAMRRELAEKKNVPPYVIFTDRSLRDMARFLPVTRSQMLECSGVGEVKFEKWGKRFLRAIADYVE